MPDERAAKVTMAARLPSNWQGGSWKVGSQPWSHPTKEMKHKAEVQAKLDKDETEFQKSQTNKAPRAARQQPGSSQAAATAATAIN